MFELSFPVNLSALASQVKRAIGKKAKAVPPPEPRKEPNRDAFDKAADFCRTHKKTLIRVGVGVGAIALVAFLIKKGGGKSVSQIGLVNININT